MAVGEQAFGDADAGVDVLEKMIKLLAFLKKVFFLFGFFSYPVAVQRHKENGEFALIWGCHNFYKTKR